MEGESFLIFYPVDDRLTEYDIFLVFSRESFKSRGGIDRISDDSCVHTVFGPDGPNYNFSGINPDPDIDFLSDARYLKSFDKVLYLDGTRQGIVRGFLLEYDHNTISEKFIDISTIFVDEFADTVEVDIEKKERSLWAYLLADARKSHDIEKHNTQVFRTRTSEDYFFISAKTDFFVDIIRNEFFKYLAQVIEILFQEIIADITFLEKGFHFLIFEEEMRTALEIVRCLLFHRFTKIFYQSRVILSVSSVEYEIGGDKYSIEKDVSERHHIYNSSACHTEYKGDKENITPKEEKYERLVYSLYTEFHESWVEMY